MIPVDAVLLDNINHVSTNGETAASLINDLKRAVNEIINTVDLSPTTDYNALSNKPQPATETSFGFTKLAEQADVDNSTALAPIKDTVTAELLRTTIEQINNTIDAIPAQLFVESLFSYDDTTNILTLVVTNDEGVQTNVDVDLTQTIQDAIATIPYATETQEGVAERATDAEVQALVDTIRYVSPAHLKILKDLIYAEILGGDTSGAPIEIRVGENISTSDTSQTFNFSRPFSQPPTTVVVSRKEPNINFPMVASGWDANGFTISRNEGIEGNTPFSYIAIFDPIAGSGTPPVGGGESTYTVPTFVIGYDQPITKNFSSSQGNNPFLQITKTVEEGRYYLADAFLSKDGGSPYTFRVWATGDGNDPKPMSADPSLIYSLSNGARQSRFSPPYVDVDANEELKIVVTISVGSGSNQPVTLKNVSLLFTKVLVTDNTMIAV